MVSEGGEEPRLCTARFAFYVSISIWAVIHLAPLGRSGREAEGTTPESLLVSELDSGDNLQIAQLDLPPPSGHHERIVRRS